MHGKLVPADPGDDVLGTERVDQDPGGTPDEPVAGGMAEYLDIDLEALPDEMSDPDALRDVFDEHAARDIQLFALRLGGFGQRHAEARHRFDRRLAARLAASLRYLAWRADRTAPQAQLAQAVTLLNEAKADFAVQRPAVVAAAADRLGIAPGLVEGYLGRFSYDFTPAHQEGMATYATTIARLAMERA